MRRISMVNRKWLLTLHLLFSAIMLGVAIIFLFLSITAAITTEEGVFKACYILMHKLSITAVRYSTVATLITGILLSVWTHWGLFKFYWIILKEGLSILSILLGPVGMYFWTLKAVSLTFQEGFNVLTNPIYTVNTRLLWTGIVLQMISLVSMFVISVFKPWGSRKQKKREKLV